MEYKAVSITHIVMVSSIYQLYGLHLEKRFVGDIVV